MSNKSSSVFGGPTSRWELGGNPSVTMFSKPQPTPVQQAPQPVAQTEPEKELPTEVVSIAFEVVESDMDIGTLTNTTKVAPQKVFISDLNEIKFIQPVEFGGYGCEYIVHFQNGQEMTVSPKIAEKIINKFDKDYIFTDDDEPQESNCEEGDDYYRS